MKIACGLFRRIERMAPEIKDSLAGAGEIELPVSIFTGDLQRLKFHTANGLRIFYRFAKAPQRLSSSGRHSRSASQVDKSWGADNLQRRD